jgi:hypothetical protein
LAVGCGGQVEDLASSQSATEAELLDAFRNATSRYKKVSKAIQDGYVLLQEPCFVEEWTEGTGEDIHLGVVYVRPSHMDGSINANDAEVLYYEPQANGSLVLMGGEYFCPLDACPTPPTIFGFTFRLEEDTGGHALHVWSWLNNPNGLTHPINPNVDTTYCNGCAHPGEEAESCDE